jgi:hypothetical protein
MPSIDTDLNYYPKCFSKESDESGAYIFRKKENYSVAQMSEIFLHSWSPERIAKIEKMILSVLNN